MALLNSQENLLPWTFPQRRARARGSLWIDCGLLLDLNVAIILVSELLVVSASVRLLQDTNSQIRCRKQLLTKSAPSRMFHFSFLFPQRTRLSAQQRLVDCSSDFDFDPFQVHPNGPAWLASCVAESGRDRPNQHGRQGNGAEERS
jgi:hypothetical protein